MTIIGISGKMGVGKDYIGDMIKRIMFDNNAIKLNFADHFKIEVCSKYNIKYEDVFHNKTKISRKLLQSIGHDTKSEFGDDIWVRVLSNWIRIHKERGEKNFIICDTRYLCEVDFIKKSGGVIIRLDAPNRNLKRLKDENADDTIKNHVSEIELDNYKFDYVLNNDNNDKLDYELKNIIVKILKNHIIEDDE